MLNGRISPPVSYQHDSWPEIPDHLRRTVQLRNSSGAGIGAGMTALIDITVSTDTLGHHVEIAPAGTLGDDAARTVIAAETVPDGEVGEFVLEGLAYAEVDAGVAAGDELTTGATTAGHLGVATVGTHHVRAVALEAVGATVTGQAKVWLT